jgi:protein SCO1/2
MQKRMRTRHGQRGLARRTLLLGTGLVAGAGAGMLAARYLLPGSPAVPPDLPGLLWPDPRTIPRMQLTDGSGATIGNERLMGRWTFMFFGYTYCPDVCPATLAQMAQVMKTLRANGAARDVQVLFVSVDPRRDLGPRLGEYVRYFDASFLGASAAEDRIEAFTGGLGVVYRLGEADESGNYPVDHTAAILLVDPDGRWVGIFNAPHEPEDIASRFQRMRDFIDAAS